MAAAEAARAGLVNEVVPLERLAAHVAEVAAGLAAGPTRAIGYAKRLINAAEDAQLEASLTDEAALQELAGRTADHAEGVAAFTEKRDPRFSGR
jgi:2-(1,2-epoxy-1,2-dihydrophenyl)acetyl-CoA isomerase